MSWVLYQMPRVWNNFKLRLSQNIMLLALIHCKCSGYRHISLCVFLPSWSLFMKWFICLVRTKNYLHTVDHTPVCCIKLLIQSHHITTLKCHTILHCNMYLSVHRFSLKLCSPTMDLKYSALRCTKLHCTEWSTI